MDGERPGADNPGLERLGSRQQANTQSNRSDGLDGAVDVIGDVMAESIDVLDFIGDDPADPADPADPLAFPLRPRDSSGEISLRSDEPTTWKKKGKGSGSSSGSKSNKLRLRWTPELHSLFVEAVHHLNGPENATPKQIMNYMKIEGLTTFHIKSHLQKYRLNCSQAKEEAVAVVGGMAAQVASSIAVTGATRETRGTRMTADTSIPRPDRRETARKKQKSVATPELTTRSDVENHHKRIEQALEVQMQMQKRLKEQLEEQRKLQLSMQAQEQHIRELKEELERSKAEDKVGSREKYIEEGQ